MPAEHPRRHPLPAADVDRGGGRGPGVPAHRVHVLHLREWPRPVPRLHTSAFGRRLDVGPTAWTAVALRGPRPPVCSALGGRWLRLAGLSFVIWPRTSWLPVQGAQGAGFWCAALPPLTRPCTWTRALPAEPSGRFRDPGYRRDMYQTRSLRPRPSATQRPFLPPLAASGLGPVSPPGHACSYCPYSPWEEGG